MGWTERHYLIEPEAGGKTKTQILSPCRGGPGDGLPPIFPMRKDCGPAHPGRCRLWAAGPRQPAAVRVSAGRSGRTAMQEEHSKRNIPLVSLPHGKKHVITRW
jgi:hypothetical protein